MYSVHYCVVVVAAGLGGSFEQSVRYILLYLADQCIDKTYSCMEN